MCSVLMISTRRFEYLNLGSSYEVNRPFPVCCLLAQSSFLLRVCVLVAVPTSPKVTRYEVILGGGGTGGSEGGVSDHTGFQPPLFHGSKIPLANEHHSSTPLPVYAWRLHGGCVEAGCVAMGTRRHVNKATTEACWEKKKQERGPCNDVLMEF